MLYNIIGDDMEKKSYLIPIIVTIIYIINAIFWVILLNHYENTNAFIDYNVQLRFITMRSFITFLVNSIFFVMIIIYFRRYKLLTFYAVWGIISAFGYHAITIHDYTGEYGSTLFRLFGSMSFFFAYMNIWIAGAIAITRKHYKIVNALLVIMALFNYVFVSFYTRYFYGLLSRFFGPFPDDLAVLSNVFRISVLIVTIGTGIIQGFVLFNLFIQKSVDIEYDKNIQLLKEQSRIEKAA